MAAPELTGVEAIDWPNAALGCPVEGVVYAQVVTPGFSLAFDHDGASYDVHTNADGSLVTSCAAS